MIADEPVRVMLADDEPLVRQGLREDLAREDGCVVVGEAGSGTDALAMARRLKPELLFLDVQMPELTGFEVLEELEPGEMPVVVFVTAYEQYAIKAFEAHAVDYLLKPFDRTRFQVALARARTQVLLRRGGTAADPELARLVATLKGERRHLQRFVVKVGDRIWLVPAADVEWIESSGNYVYLHQGTKAHLLRETLTNIEKQLDPRLFARIHRSTIVRLSAISEMERLPAGDFSVKLANGPRLTLSRSFRKAFEERIGHPL